MIQCPICQVLNEDAALFCAECGQRFSAPGQPQGKGSQPPQQPSPSDSSKPDTSEPRKKSVKLRSPMLGGGGDDDDDEEGYDKPQMGKLRGTGASTGGRKHLRSPLLGGDDDGDDYEEPEDSRSSRRKRSAESQEGTGKKKKLRSPLLGEDDEDDDDDEDFAPTNSAPGKGTKLRSPLLGQDDDDDEPQPRMRKLRSPVLGDSAEPHSPQGRHKGGLHSPLLGDAGYDDDDDDDDEDVAPRKRSSTTAGGKPKLRSSLLGGGYDDEYDDDWDEDEDEDDDNPDVLRSPLLAAKRRRPKPSREPEHTRDTPPAHAQTSQPAPQMQQPHPQPYAPQVQSGVGQFPGPIEPQPPWPANNAPPLPGAPVPSGFPPAVQQQPGQPWPPQAQPGPHAQASAGNPPLPVESVPGGPPWQNRMVPPAPTGFDPSTLSTAGQADVPPIVDDNDEFQLDIPAPASLSLPSMPQEPESPPRAMPVESRAQRRTDSEDSGDQSAGPQDRRQNRIERRKNPDRRFSSLIEEKGSSARTSRLDYEEDEFSIGRPQAAANAGLAKMMLGLGGAAMGFKIYEFIKVMGMWDLSKMPEFLLEQFFSGLAIVGLIVLALSCMKK